MANVASHKFVASILRKYDIRGVIDINLGVNDAYYLGLSYATYAARIGHKGAICVGYDGRISSPLLEQALVRGLSDAGYDVICVGLVPTPLLYFATCYITEAVGGIMITGSHNPPNENGFKIVLGGNPVFDEVILEIGDIAAKGEFRLALQPGAIRKCDIVPAYIAKLISLNSVARPLKIAWDPGNGVVGTILPQLVSKLPGQHVLINQIVDGSFPAHHPDPSVAANLVQLQELVLAEECDIGFAFDGDGDRLGVVDDKGNILYGDHLLLLLANDLLLRHPGAKIVADIKSSNVVLQQIAAWGGTPILWKTGHSFIKMKMKEEGALLAGEMSGHLFFAEDYYGFDDAIFAAAKMMTIVAYQAKPLSELLAALPKMINTPEIRIDCPEERKFPIIKEAKEYLKAHGIVYSDLDGVRVASDQGWWLLRPSNTQSCLVARAEGIDIKTLQETISQLKSCLAACNVSIDL